MRLLIIDDSPTARAAFEEAGAEVGFMCVGVASELEAMATMEREECQALLVDAHLDLGVSGIEVGRRFKERHPMLKVAIVSATAGVRLQSSARASGFRLLMKPVSGADLLRCFGKPIARRAAGPAANPAAVEIVARELALASAGLSNAHARDERQYWAHRIKGIAIMLEENEMRELASALERAAESAPEHLSNHLHTLLLNELERVGGRHGARC